MVENKRSIPRPKVRAGTFQAGGQPWNRVHFFERYSVAFNEVKQDLELYDIAISQGDSDVSYIEGTSKGLFFEIHRSFHCLKTWYEVVPGPKSFHWFDLFKRQFREGAFTANFIKEFKETGCRNFLRVGVDHRPMKSDPECIPVLENYSCTPPEFYLINFHEDKEDVFLMNERPNFGPGFTEYMEEICEIIRDLLPDIDPRISDEDILALDTGSQSMIDWKRMPFYQARLSKHGSDFLDRVEAELCVIPVGPANYRDALIMDIRSYNSIIHCNKEVLKILDELPGSGITSSDHKYRERLARIERNAGDIDRCVYFHRDFKKNGITVPREILFQIAEVLQERYPDCHFYRFFAYKNFVVKTDEKRQNHPLNPGTFWSPKRGTGLGFEGPLFTLFQIAHCEWIQRRHPEFNIKVMTVNDDMIYKITRSAIWGMCDAHWSLDYWEKVEETDFLVLENEAGMLIHRTKGYWSEHSQICENYSHPNYRHKQGLRECALATAFSAVNIFHAKVITNNLSDWLRGSDSEWEVLSRLVEYWGYEFFPAEHQYSFSLGGWITRFSYGLSLVLREVLEASVSELDMLYTAWKRRDAKVRRQPKAHVSEGLVPIENVTAIGRKMNIMILKDIPSDIVMSMCPPSCFAQNSDDYTAYHKKMFFYRKAMLQHLVRGNARRQGKTLPCGFRENFIKEIVEEEWNLALPQEYAIECENHGDITFFEDTQARYYHIKGNAIGKYMSVLETQGYITRSIGVKRELPLSIPICALEMGYKEAYVPIVAVCKGMMASLGGLSCNIPLLASEYYDTYGKVPTGFALWFEKPIYLDVHKFFLRDPVHYFLKEEKYSSDPERIQVSDEWDSFSIPLSEFSRIWSQVDQEDLQSQSCKNPSDEKNEGVNFINGMRVCIRHSLRPGTEFHTKIYEERLFKTRECELCQIVYDADIHAYNRSLIYCDTEERRERTINFYNKRKQLDQLLLELPGDVSTPLRDFLYGGDDSDDEGPLGNLWG
jgi:hypothetical protein